MGATSARGFGDWGVSIIVFIDPPEDADDGADATLFGDSSAFPHAEQNLVASPFFVPHILQVLPTSLTSRFSAAALSRFHIP
jgi:hypothetical protein